MSQLQGSLLASIDAISLSSLNGSVVRTDLGGGAWCDLRRGWVEGSDSLFERLEHTIPWRAEQRRMYDRVVAVPRLVFHYDHGDALPDPILEEARDALTNYYDNEPGGALVSAGLCLYRDGRDSVAWHGDRVGRGATEDVVVAIVSLGAPRRLLLRPSGGGQSRSFEIGRGDLFVMGGSCQRTWDHSVPKAASIAGARISVQFRPHDTR